MFQTLEMSIFNIFNIKQYFLGSIKVNKRKNFGYFSMNTSIVKQDFTPTLRKIQENMQAKNIHGDLVFVEFVNHDGAHISLWMKPEGTSDSIESIIQNIGEWGEFFVQSYGFKKNDRSILFAAKGNFLFNYCIYTSNIYFKEYARWLNIPGTVQL
jgi:hypothetical protein